MQDPPHRPRVPLRVRVSFEPNRLAADHLAAAYDHLLPDVRRAVRGQPQAPTRPACPEQARAGKEHA